MEIIKKNVNNFLVIFKTYHIGRYEFLVSINYKNMLIKSLKLAQILCIIHIKMIFQHFSFQTFFMILYNTNKCIFK